MRRLRAVPVLIAAVAIAGLAVAGCSNNTGPVRNAGNAAELPAPPATTFSTLEEGQELHRGDRVVSQNGRYWISFEQDGQLLMWHGSQKVGGTTYWFSRVEMSDDGDFIGYHNADETILWSSGTKATSESGPLFLRASNNGVAEIVGHANNKVYWTASGQWD